MRSSIHGTFATLLLLIPVGAIPALAIFGIPQFAPVVASPLREGHEGDREHRVGQSARAPADDLFHDDTDFPSHGDDALSAPGRLGDSVPVPNRNVARNLSSRDRDVGNQAAELPSWAEDSAVDDSRPTHPRRDGLKSDRIAKNGDDSPGMPGGNEGAAPRRSFPNGQGAIRL
ncbi:MAG: hypothetical protein H7062_05095, partial [Candidatus Saccharimonas sp.]|nr:hypothetical protein [Planctomycetaceae bacterium]